MARLSFRCRDSQGDVVTITSSEADSDDLLKHYAGYKQFLTEAGFTILSAEGPKPRRSSRRRNKEVVTFDGKTCPKCGSRVWDNREKKKNGEWKQSSPDFSCRDCDWAVWPGQYKIAA